MNKILILILASTFSLSACGGFLGSKVIPDNTEAANKDYDTVNGSITVGHNANVGDLSTVNGSIKVASSSTIGAAETVNGSVVFEEQVSAKSASTVNGTIKLGNHCYIEENVETVNGSITANSQCEIGGDFQTVNGKLMATDTEIHGNVETVNGRIVLLDGTVVHDDIIIKKNKGFFNKDKNKPEVILGKDVVVKGDLEFGRAVKLYVHDSVEIDDEIENAEIIKFSGDETPY